MTFDAVVLGPGGLAGTAWMIGLADGRTTASPNGAATASSARRLAEVFAVLGDARLERGEARRLLVTAVDVETGEPAVWEPASGVPLAAAVAASTAVPGALPPVTVGGRRYMDGALRDGTNADLAAGARTLVVVEPLAHLFPTKPTTGVRIVPDAAAVEAFGPNLLDRTAWRPALQAGARQAPEAAERIHAAMS